MIFRDEVYNVSGIYNVVRYAPKGQSVYKYPATLPTHELMYIIKGSIVLSFHGKKMSVGAGDIVYLPKGIEGTDYSMRVLEDFDLYNVYFHTDSPMPKEAVLLNASEEIFKSLYEKLYRTWKGKSEGYYFKSMQQFYYIIERLHFEQGNYASSSSLSRLDKAEEYMAEHYCDAHFDYNALCAATELSYSHFKKLFIRRYGAPPVKYITLKKINRAAELLLTEKFSVSEVAELCGFENVYYFSNVFKRYKGVSPKGFQKSK